MIGKIELKDGTVAEMQDDGSWTSTDSTLELALIGYDANWYRGVGVLPFGHDAIGAAAREFDAKATYSRPVKPIGMSRVS